MTKPPPSPNEGSQHPKRVVTIHKGLSPTKKAFLFDDYFGLNSQHSICNFEQGFSKMSKLYLHTHTKFPVKSNADMIGHPVFFYHFMNPSKVCGVGTGSWSWSNLVLSLDPS